MKKKVMLPTCEPVLATYNHQIIQSVVAMQNPTLYNWILNEAVSLQCGNIFLRGHNSIMIGIPLFNTMYAMPHIERLTINTRFVRKDIHSIMKNMLNQGYYVAFANVDDYYMQGKSLYGVKHFLHDGLICGYDDSKARGLCKMFRDSRRKSPTYKIMAYDKHWKCSLFDIPQYCLEEGIDSAVREGVYSDLVAMKAKPIKSEFHIKGIRTNLKNYLNSNLEIYPPDDGDYVYGIVVHNYTCMYLDKLHSGDIPYDDRDRRILRLIWEHKKLMTDRIRAVEKRLHWDDEMSKRCAANENEADKIRLLYLKYNIKEDNTLLPLISKRLMDIKQTEEKLLNEFILKIDKSLFEPYSVRITSSSLDVHEGPGTDCEINFAISSRDTYTIVEEHDGKDAKKWGKLKSGEGWIPLDFTERLKTP